MKNLDMPAETADRDWFLQNLVSMVNGRDLEIGITLQANGFLVSGLLVSGHKYFEGFGSDFASAFSVQEDAEVIRESYAKFGGIYTTELPADSEIAPPNFIHLKNAKFFNTHGNPIPGNRGVWWRGRVSQIDGFILGSLSAENT